MAGASNIDGVLQEILRRLPARSPETSETNTTLLLEILQRLSVLETQNASIISEQSRAAAGRTGTYKDIGQLQLDVADLQRTAEDHGPKIGTLYDVYNQGRGKAALGMVLWGALISLFAGAVGAMMTKLGWR